METVTFVTQRAEVWAASAAARCVRVVPGCWQASRTPGGAGQGAFCSRPATSRRRLSAAGARTPPSVRRRPLVRACSHPACRARAQAEAPSNPGFTPLITLKRPGTVNATRSPAHPPGAEPPAGGGGAAGGDAGGAAPARPHVPAQTAGQGSAATPDYAASPPHPQPGAASASPLQATPGSSSHPRGRRTRPRARPAQWCAAVRGRSPPKRAGSGTACAPAGLGSACD